MGWSDMYLYNFRIHGKDYGIIRPCGKIFSDQASEVKLATNRQAAKVAKEKNKGATTKIIWFYARTTMI
jgi:hypothetical protein